MVMLQELTSLQYMYVEYVSRLSMLLVSVKHNVKIHAIYFKVEYDADCLLWFFFSFVFLDISVILVFFFPQKLS